jgi:hypothetical protein
MAASPAVNQSSYFNGGMQNSPLFRRSKLGGEMII